MFNKRITTVILEESNSEAEKLASVLSFIPEIILKGKAVTIRQGLALVSSKLPQMVFVNIELADGSGYDLVRKLHKRNIFPNVVFIAGNSHSAYDALALKPFDFLTKPLNKPEVLEMLGRYKVKIRKNMLVSKLDLLSKNFDFDTKRTFKYKNGIIVLNLDEILICKSSRAKTLLILKNGEEIKLSSGIKETMQTINHESFVKSSRSYWINRNYLRKIDKRRSKCTVHNNDGKSWEVPVSRDTIQLFETLITYPVS
jgi:two-component system LytT family response regulator